MSGYHSVIPDRIVQGTLWIGFAATILSAAAWLLAPQTVLRAYLTAYLFWWSVPLGCTAVLMLWHVVGGQWEAGLRPLMASTAVSLPLVMILFAPVLLALPSLYSWATPHTEHALPVVAAKSIYLNAPFFGLRAAVFFLLWIGLAIAVSRKARSAMYSRSRIGALGLIIYVITVTFAAIDWIGSLHPEWYSSILGLYVIASQGCMAFALLILAAAWLNRNNPSQPPVSPQALHDLGNLLFAFVILHAYMAYSQFFIIWNGNLPHEISWYLPRTRGWWGAYTMLLIVVDFAIPFVALLSADLKRNERAMAIAAGTVITGRLLEAIWFTVPAYVDSMAMVLVLMPMAFTAIGGIWVSLFLRVWRRGPLYVPVRPTAEIR